LAQVKLAVTHDTSGYVSYNVAQQLLSEPSATETYMARLNKMIKYAMADPAAAAAGQAAAATVSGDSEMHVGSVGSTAGRLQRTQSTQPGSDDEIDESTNGAPDEPILSGSVRQCSSLSRQKNWLTTRLLFFRALFTVPSAHRQSSSGPTYSSNGIRRPKAVFGSLHATGFA
jgi:hypothetical protein